MMINFHTIREPAAAVQRFDEEVASLLNNGWSIKKLDTLVNGNTTYLIAFMIKGI